MRVMVTGAAGFIGSSVSERLLARGDTVLGVDDFNDFYDPGIKRQNVAEVQNAGGSRFQILRANLVDDVAAVRAVFADPAQRPDAICHLAAWAGVRPSIQKPLVYQKNNVQGTLELLELARQFEVRAFVYASSSSVYGDRGQVPFTEEDRVDHPVSPYAATKKCCELLGETYAHLFGLRTIGLRFFTVYGPRQRPEMAIHLFARSILAGQPITLFGDGGSSRDYTYIDDCVSGVVAAIDRAQSHEGARIYNLGASDTTTLSELVARIEDALGKKAQIEWRPFQPGDVTRTYADVSRAGAELGYRVTTPIADGIPAFCRWLKAHA